MDLKQWQWCQPEYDELLPLGRVAKVGETTMFLLGFLRKGDKVELCTLEHDHGCDMAGLLRRAKVHQGRRPDTNRQALAVRHMGSEPRWLMGCVRRLEIGGRTYAVRGSSSGLLGDVDSRFALLAGQFLRAGVTPPSELEGISLEQLHFCQTHLKGAFRRIPKGFAQGPIQLGGQPRPRAYRTWRKLTLEVGKPYPKPIVCKRGAERTVFYIQDVSLYDWLGETEQRLKDPQYTAGMGPEQMEEFQTRVFPAMEKKCPRGKRLVIVAYESAGVQPELYLTDYLDRAPDYSGTGVGMVMQLSREPGMHDLPVRPLVLEGAVEADASSVEVALLGVMVDEPEFELLI